MDALKQVPDAVRDIRLQEWLNSLGNRQVQEQQAQQQQSQLQAEEAAKTDPQRSRDRTVGRFLDIRV